MIDIETETDTDTDIDTDTRQKSFYLAGLNGGYLDVTPPSWSKVVERGVGYDRILAALDEHAQISEVRLSKRAIIIAGFKSSPSTSAARTRLTRDDLSRLITVTEKAIAP